MVDRLGLKVDVDTLEGMREGVPALLRLFERHDIRATFFLSFGPDQSGRAVFRLMRPGFLKKMMRTRAVEMYGWRAMLRGTLLPATWIAANSPSLVREIEAAGHEVGVHCWNHVLWQDHLPRLSRERVEEELRRAVDAYVDALGHPPHSCAAPAWMVTASSLEVQDSFALDYCSDVRGEAAFMPRMNGRTFRTPQIPTTLPTLDEVLGVEGVGREGFNDHLLTRMIRPSEVHTVHAEAEGRAYRDLLDELLTRLAERDRKVVPLSDLALSIRLEELPVHEVVVEAFPGRAGRLAQQGELSRDSARESQPA